ncbi:sigma-70 family RNA polymerase sigma factor [Gottfriedia solisilvae]|uniref:DNA-directed RNA polymerase sigma-70 factor n=1 Tax=Gottfriedia solisilvae TaxID=1516104 RepID=A0A8J3AKP2_9BACI|nr:sigma-70 family RNA polymerase sigma factor [Gottfriedia solisilvae]GGI15353.1 DNA-directed RNA polymerase sigma-70 factor [Gottfriedia solisilvae]
MIQLVKEAQQGNDNAFLKLFQEYENDIYRTAFVYVKNQEDALDVVQETAYRAFKSIKNLKEPKYLKTWIIKIAISCSIDVLRKQKKVVELKPEVEKVLSSKDEKDISLSMTLDDLIQLLNETEKKVIILRYYFDFTIKEVSETLNIPLGTAKTILYRGLNKLRKELNGDEMYER